MRTVRTQQQYGHESGTYRRQTKHDLVEVGLRTDFAALVRLDVLPYVTAIIPCVQPPSSEVGELSIAVRWHVNGFPDHHMCRGSNLRKSMLRIWVSSSSLYRIGNGG